jgi:hypothetical protein
MRSTSAHSLHRVASLAHFLLFSYLGAHISLSQGGVFGAVATSEAFLAALAAWGGAENGIMTATPPKTSKVVKVRRLSVSPSVSPAISIFSLGSWLQVAAEPYEYELPLGRTAVVMIDFQRDFILHGGFGDALGNDVDLLMVCGSKKN